MKPRVLVCGLIATDIMFSLPELPGRADKYRATDSTMVLGGGGAIAAVALQRLGGKALLAGRLGMDQFGLRVIDLLEHEGVDCDRVQRLNGARSSVSSIVIDAAGERQIINFRGDLPSAASSEAAAKNIRSHSDDIAGVLVDTRWVEGALSALLVAQLHCVPAVLDAEAPVSEKIMAQATHIAFSRQGLLDYTQADHIESGLKKVAERFGHWVCVTDGARGVHFLNGGSLYTVPGHAINVVDTLGAGDVWHAAFTLQLARGKSEEVAITYANVAAALKCTRSGGGDGAPRESEVEDFLIRSNG